MAQQYNIAEDFLLNDSFLRYRMGIDEEAVRYWEAWRDANPDKRLPFEEACRLFDVLNGNQGRLDVEVGHFRNLLKVHVEQQEVTMPKVRSMGWWRYAAAAVLLLMVSVAGWKLVIKVKPAPEITMTTASENDVQPGSTKAQLLLGDGTAVNPDELSEQGLEEKDGTRIGKNKGQLVYDAAEGTGKELIYNTLTTPRGGEYKVTLPDGSRVWMNAGSSLRFPTRFHGSNRTVYLSGEAYFEVAQNPAQPFLVQMPNGLKVAVLGTGFNIMAYEDESALNTTLITGKVKVISPDGKDVVLSPSQQAVLSRKNGQMKVEEANVDKVIAWKGGMFEFDDDDLSTVMRQLSRWYDVDVKYSGPIPDKHYTGSIRKLSTLSQALRILKTAGIRFTIDGRQIIVDVQE